ncbi:putative PH-like domain superfamily protein [Plasmopara halstedii]
MSYGGNVEGYLLKIDGDEARTVYCILDEGILQYFSRMGGELLGAIALSGSKVDVFLLPPVDELGQVPHQFRVDAQSRNLPNRRRNNRQPMNDGKIRTITFAGSTREVADQWAISILNWNRYSWEDGQIICSSKDEYRNLQKIISRSGTTNEKTTESVVPITVSPAVRPL